MPRSILLLIAFLMWMAGARSEQLVVGIAGTSDAHPAHLRLFSRKSGDAWKPDSEIWPVIVGKKGVAWGRGLNPAQEGPQKREGDGKAPLGRFRIGTIYGMDAELPKGSRNWPYVALGPWDAWVDDSNMPEYNHHVRVDPLNVPSWFPRQRMKIEDPIYHWLVLIEHNYPKSVPYGGSAIFFHTRRGENVPSAGCTTMERKNLETLIRWLDPKEKPQYVLLGREDYLRLWRQWNLPEPGMLQLTGNN